MSSVLSRRLLTRRVISNISFCEYSNLLSPCNYVASKKLFRKRLVSSDNVRIKFISVPLVDVPSASVSTSDNEEPKEPKKKLTLFQKFRQMYRDYWYVLVPVHLVTSAAWFGGFYYMAKSGIDIVSILESMNVSEKLTNPLKDSSMGYIAVAYALYKISTPARYTVTLGGTTISINYLKKWGYIKPVPTTEQMKKIYHEKRSTLTKSMKDTKGSIIEKKHHLIETLQEKKEGIKGKKESILKSVSDTSHNLKKRKIQIKGQVSDYKDKT